MSSIEKIEVEGPDDMNQIDKNEIRDRIHTIRGVQVILDNDLAYLYNVETRTLNQAMKRNKDRFPDDFCFKLTRNEFDILRSQSVMSRWGGRRTLPYGFTEQGVAMLSSILKSKVAVNVSIGIMRAFVQMRRFMMSNAQIFQRMDAVEKQQHYLENRVEDIFSAIESKQIVPQQGIFFEGQIFDAYEFISRLVRSAKRSIIIIDDFIDESVLLQLSKRKKGVWVAILTRNIPESLKLDVSKFNDQYPDLYLREFKMAHDRFIIIDRRDVYHLGASLKDLGKKWFAFSRMDIVSVDILSKIDELIAR
jgi:hypothetical protein